MKLPSALRAPASARSVTPPAGPSHSHDVTQPRLISPSPIAMVWEAPGAPHQAVAVPGVGLAPSDALVQLELTTISESDIHTALGHLPAPAPLVLGHEQVGHVVAVGEDARCVDGSRLEVGDRAVWSVTVSCGDCDRCRRSLTQMCRALRKYGHERMERGWELSGGFASHVHLRAGTAIVRVDRGLPAHVAAPASGGTATAAAAVRSTCEIVDPAGEVALVIGADLIAMTVTAMLADAGARVIVADSRPQRRELARRFGAAGTIDLAEPETSDGGKFQKPDAPADGPLIVVETSGSHGGVSTAIDRVAAGGVVVLAVPASLAAPFGRQTLDAESIVRRQVTVRGVHDYTAQDLRAAVGYLTERHRAYPFAELVGATFSLADVDEALAVASSEQHVRVALSAAR